MKSWRIWFADSLYKIRKNYKNNKRKMVNTWNAIRIWHHIVESEGTLALEKYLDKIKMMKPPCYKFLKNVLFMLMDGVDANIILAAFKKGYF